MKHDLPNNAVDEPIPPTEKPKGIRAIDGEKINEAAIEAARTLYVVRETVDMVRERGIDVTLSVFGVTLSFHIELGERTQ